MSEIDNISERIRVYRETLDDALGNWAAKRELAAAVRELMNSMCATDAPEEELRAISEQVQQSARRFADQREQFLEVCRAQDKPAAQVMREFMRKYVADPKSASHQDRQSLKTDAPAPAVTNLKREVRHG